MYIVLVITHSTSLDLGEKHTLSYRLGTKYISRQLLGKIVNTHLDQGVEHAGHEGQLASVKVDDGAAAPAGVAAQEVHG